MKLSHKKVYDIIAEKRGLTYRKGKGGDEPTNFTYFENVANETYMKIEIIPSGAYLKTIYVMFIKGNETQWTEIANIIKEEYQKQSLLDSHFCIDFNSKDDGIVF